MNLIFLNPWGLLALLGIPAILAIHFLQRQMRRIPISTLFLIEKIGAQSLSGKRWERLRNSLPLWLQLLAVLLLTLMLTQPRMVRDESVQRVVVVLDTTWSMSAFREEVLQQLPSYLEKINRRAARTEWLLLESDGQRGRLYTGDDLAALRRGLDAWYPALPAHDFVPSWRLGISLLQGQGTVLFVTDHLIPQVPPGVEVLSYGEPVANIGFTGFTTNFVDEAGSADPAGTLRWTALVRNYSDAEQATSWHVESGEQAGTPTTLVLGPGETRALRGRFPEELERMTLALQGDAFTADDRLPIVRPQPKTLNLAIRPNSPHAELFQRIVNTIPATEAVPFNPFADNGPDALLAGYNPLDPSTLPAFPGVFFVNEPAQPRAYESGLIYAEEHPLTEYLSWQNLLVQSTLKAPLREGDEVLVWQENQPLIFLRPVENRPAQLILNFDPRYSNANRVPAVVVIISRYLENLRADKRALEVNNVDCNQLLQLPTDPDRQEQIYVRAIGGPAIPEDFREFFAEQLSLVRAPRVPTFFEVRQGDDILYRGAAQFVDSREANLRDAASTTNDSLPPSLMTEREQQTASLAPLWLLLLLSLFLANWLATWRNG